MNVEQQKTIVKGVGFCCLVLVIFGVLWFMFDGTDLLYSRSGDSRTADELRRIGEEQRDAVERSERIQRGLERSIEGADSVSTGIGKAEERLNSVTERSSRNEATLGDSQSRIAACREILERVRERPCTSGEPTTNTTNSMDDSSVSSCGSIHF